MSKLNVEVWTERPQEERPLFIRTQKIGPSIFTSICDESGKMCIGGTLSCIREDGTMIIYKEIDRNLAARAGIQLDSEGRIKLEE